MLRRVEAALPPAPRSALQAHFFRGRARQAGLRPGAHPVWLSRPLLQGVSLLEVLVALLVLALLSSLALPAYQDSLRKARRAEGRTAVWTVLQQQETHYSRYGRYQPFSANQPQGFKWFSGESAADSAYELSAADCEDVGSHPCIQVNAQPGTSRVGVKFRDAHCGTLTLASNGRKTSGGELRACW